MKVFVASVSLMTVRLSGGSEVNRTSLVFRPLLSIIATRKTHDTRYGLMLTQSKQFLRKTNLGRPIVLESPLEVSCSMRKHAIETSFSRPQVSPNRMHDEHRCNVSVRSEARMIRARCSSLAQLALSILYDDDAIIHHHAL